MGVTEIISETPITREEIEAAMKDTGYKIFFDLGCKQIRMEFLQFFGLFFCCFGLKTC